MGYSTNAYYTLVIHEDAHKDLDSIFEVDEDTGGEIVALLEILRSNQDLLDRLTQRGFQNYGVPYFTVDEWQEARRSKFNLWRIRQLSSADAGQYRIIYAFHPQELRYFVLAILNRNFVYDTSIPRVKRIFDLYDACNIPRY